MARKNNGGSITFTGSAARDFMAGAIAAHDTTIKADGPQTTPEENQAAMAPGIEHFDDMGERSDVDPSNGQDGGESHEPDGPPHSDATPERTGADVIADLLAVKVRLELERARWEGIEAEQKKAWGILADELGARAKKQHVTRKPVRIGGTLYEFKFTKATKVYSLIESGDPVEVK